MLAMAQDLVRHKWYADARLLAAIQAHPGAAEDKQLRDLLHHIILANRFWLMRFLQKPFAHEEESRAPETITQIVALFRETQSEELGWLSRLSQPDLDRNPRNASAFWTDLLRCSGTHAGLHAQPGSPGTMRSTPSAPRRRSAYAGFHPLAEGTPRARVADIQLIRPGSGQPACASSTYTVQHGKHLRRRNISTGMYI